MLQATARLQEHGGERTEEEVVAENLLVHMAGKELLKKARSDFYCDRLRGVSRRILEGRWVEEETVAWFANGVVEVDLHSR